MRCSAATAGGAGSSTWSAAASHRSCDARFSLQDRVGEENGQARSSLATDSSKLTAVLATAARLIPSELQPESGIHEYADQVVGVGGGLRARDIRVIPSRYVRWLLVKEVVGAEIGLVGG